MSAEPTDREIAAVARSAAEIIQRYGKATGELEDDRGRVSAPGALLEAGRGYGYSCALLADRVLRATEQPLTLADWSDLPTTTAEDIAKVFLKVADEAGR